MTERFFVHPDSHLPADFSLAKVSTLLHSLGYRLAAIGEICDHVYVYGTAEGCPEFHNEVERQLVEDMLPMAHDAAWEHASEYRWSTAG